MDRMPRPSFADAAVRQWPRVERTADVMLAPESILGWIIIGAIAGWLAGVLVKGYGFGLIGNIVASLLGALILLFLVGLVRRT
jgi:hypothetical protein